MVTKGKWFKVIDKENRQHILSHGKSGNMEQNIAVMSVRPEARDNAHLIAACVNGCVEVNPDNPQAVAESIKAMYKALKEIKQIVAGSAYERSVEKQIIAGKCFIALAKVDGK